MKKIIGILVITLLIATAFSGTINGMVDIYEKDKTNNNFKTQLMQNQAGTDNWLMFHHNPEHTGYNPYSIGPKIDNVLWKKPMGAGIASSVAVVHDLPGQYPDRIYFTNFNGDLICADEHTGDVIFNVPTNGGGPDMRSSPAIDLDNNYVFVGCNYPLGGLFRCNLLDGTNPINGFLVDSVVSSSPVIFGDYVYIGCINGKIYKCDKNCNMILREYTGGSILSSPAIDTIEELLFIGSNDNKLYCYDLNLVEQWNFPTGGEVISSPTITDDYVIFGSNDNYVYCINKSNGGLVWKFETLNDVTSTATVHEDMVFIGSNDTSFYCLEKEGMLNGNQGMYYNEIPPDDGDVLWYFDVDFRFVASPVLADWKIYINCIHSDMYCLDKTPDNDGDTTLSSGEQNFNEDSDEYNMWWPADPCPYPIDDDDTDGIYNEDPDMGDPSQFKQCYDVIWSSSIESTRASPVISGGKLFIGVEDGYMYCFGHPDVFINDNIWDDGIIPSWDYDRNQIKQYPPNGPDKPEWRSSDIFNVPTNPDPNVDNYLYAHVHNLGELPAYHVNVSFFYHEWNNGLNFPYDPMKYAGSSYISEIPPGGFVTAGPVQWYPTGGHYCVLAYAQCSEDVDPVLWESNPGFDNNIGWRNFVDIPMEEEPQGQKWRGETEGIIKNVDTVSRDIVMNFYSPYIPTDTWEINAEIDGNIYDLVTGHVSIPIPDMAANETLEFKIISKASLDTEKFESTITTWETINDRVIGGTTQRFFIYKGKGNDIIFHEDYGDSIWRMQSDGSGQIQIIEDGWYAKYSPDFSKIAYSDYYDNGIWVMNADGSNPQPLTSNGTAPFWSPYGNQIVYHVGGVDPLNRRIWIVDANGANPHKITDNPGSFPEWSPDGEWIAYHGHGTGIWIIQPNGQDNKNIHAKGGYPSWKPDYFVPLEICYSDLSDGHYIWRMKVDTTQGIGYDHINISEYPGIHPDWCPNDEQITYEAGDPDPYTWIGIRVVNLTDPPDDHMINDRGHAPDWGNAKPDKPTIKGPPSGKPGSLYEYTFNAVDPDGDDVKYHIDWGDGIFETTDFYPSGDDVKLKHSWDNKGTYSIKAKAEDRYGLVSPEGTLTVTMPRNRAINRQFLNFLQQYYNLLPILKKILLLQ